MKYPLDDVICFCYKRAKLFRRSSVVEQLTVNQLVVGSSPTAGAIFYTPPRAGANQLVFLLFFKLFNK